jgi:hypothetical protein
MNPKEQIVAALADGEAISLPVLTTAVCGELWGVEHGRAQACVKRCVLALEAEGRVEYGRGGGSARYQGLVRLLKGGA